MIKKILFQLPPKIPKLHFTKDFKTEDLNHSSPTKMFFLKTSKIYEYQLIINVYNFFLSILHIS